LARWVKFNDCRGWKKCEKVRKNATFARYLGAILCNLKQKKMYSSEFCVRFATFYRNEKSSQKKSDFSLCWYEICVGGVTVNRLSLVGGTVELRI
jgi:hypothetical protein